jgi:hypothetical protein
MRRPHIYSIFFVEYQNAIVNKIGDYMRGAIKYKRKEVILMAIFLGLYIITFIYLANEYLSSPLLSTLSP